MEAQPGSLPSLSLSWTHLPCCWLVGAFFPPCRISTPCQHPCPCSFDKTFCETAPQLEQDYSVPAVFPDDLFALLGATRPDWRWLIIGPLRSGSR